MEMQTAQGALLQRSFTTDKLNWCKLNQRSYSEIKFIVILFYMRYTQHFTLLTKRLYRLE